MPLGDGRDAAHSLKSMLARDIAKRKGQRELTAQELVKFINRPGSVSLSGLTIGIKVLDVREIFGRMQLLVVPLHGTGEAWLDRDKISLIGGQQ